MKKFISIILVLTLALCLCACGNNVGEVSTDTSATSSQTESVSSTASQNESQVTSVDSSSQTPSTTQTSSTSSTTSTTSSTTSVTSSAPVHTHTYSAATCTEPQKCSCGETKGTALGHKWRDATCTTPKTCSVCKVTEGAALTHKWVKATCSAPKTCSVCKVTEGKALGHKFTNGKCSVCNTKDPDFKEYDTYINGVGYYLGQELTVDIVLKTKDKDFRIIPCFTYYQKVNGSWVPADLMKSVADFRGEQPTIWAETGVGLSIPTGNGNEEIVYGEIWSSSNVIWEEKEDGIYGITGEHYDFSQGLSIRRFKYKVTEKGVFEFRVQDGDEEWSNDNKYTDSLSVKIY